MSSPSAVNPRSYTLNIRRPHARSRSAMTSTTAPLSEPPRGMAQPHHNRDMALQKYLLLQEEHEHLRQHLDSLQGFQTSRTSPQSSATAGSLSASPTLTNYPASSSSSQTNPFESRSPSLSRYHSGDRRHSSVVTKLAAEEARLCDINEGIKRVLTELLNCDTVRHDRAFRTWVQCRLMDTEKELRTGRRRRSAPEPCTTE
jgi:hypothetical protein